MSVFLTNLDDFIAPSQGCVNPFVAARAKGLSSESSKLTLALSADFSNLQSDNEVKPNLIKLKPSVRADDPKVAAVSLNDCLACR